MGASDSKLVFKKGIFRLSEERDILADDPYWTSVSSQLILSSETVVLICSVLGAPRIDGGCFHSFFGGRDWEERFFWGTRRKRYQSSLEVLLCLCSNVAQKNQEGVFS